GLAGRTALVTELPELAALPLADFDQMVFGGWDVAPTGLLARARGMANDDRALPEARVRPGVVEGGGPATRALARSAFVGRRAPLAKVVERLGDDLDTFRRTHGLDTVVGVNLASTEPPI